MNSDIKQIDRIVREVIRRLDQEPGSPAASPSTASVDSVDSDESTTLRIDDRVVTGNLLNGRLQGVGCLEVRGDAVVTPLVKDLLREKKVELQRVTRTPCARSRRWLLVEEGCCDPERLLAELKSIDVEWMRTDDWPQQLDSMSEGDLAVVVTPLWAARVCQANRCKSVRAVHAVDSTAVQQAMEQVNANMVIIHAAQHNEASAAEIVREFLREPVASSE